MSWKAILGIAVSALLLWYALRDVHFAEIVREARGSNGWMMLAAVAAGTATFVLRAFRWGPLLAATPAPKPLRARLAATFIGFAVNNLLPARIGEVARAYALSRAAPVPISSAIGSLVVERILDGFMVIGLLLLATALPSFPELGLIGGRDVGASALLLMLIFSAAAFALLAVVLWPDRALKVLARTVGWMLPKRARRRAGNLAAALVRGLGVLRMPGPLSRALAWSIVIWLVNAFSFWLAFLAFDIRLPFSAALFVQGILALAIAIPAAPGFFGVFESAFRVGLVQVWGVDPQTAVSCAIVFHIAGFIPVTVIGMIAAWRIGFSVRRIAAEG